MKEALLANLYFETQEEPFNVINDPTNKKVE
jgi:hypothetical protein